MDDAHRALEGASVGPLEKDRLTDVQAGETGDRHGELHLQLGEIGEHIDLAFRRDRLADIGEARVVETGDGDEKSVEIVKGLSPGETVAVDNSFVLKAEAGKNEIPEE